jgi:hypothetical protein
MAMHTSNLVFYLFFAAVAVAALAQLMNYFSIAREQRTRRRQLGLALGLTAVILSAVSGYMAAIDWAALPTSPDGLRPGQLWDDGGIPAIVR